MRWLLLAVLAASCAKSQANTDPQATSGVVRTPGGCAVGDSQGCTCGGTSSGSRTCVTPEGLWTACGCATEGGPTVAVAPEPPAPQVCGAQTCAPYVEEDTEVGAKGCCTSAGTCGSKSKFLFGDACVERGGNVGQPSPTECPDESVNFVDLQGCCRPDGACGLAIDEVTNFDLGCVERSQMQRLLNEGAGDRNFLSTIFFLPVRPASFPARTCSFRP